jgi:lipase
MRIDVSYADRAQARADRIRNGWADIEPDLVEAELDHHLIRADDGRWSWRYNRSALVGLLGELTRPVPPPPDGVPTLLVIATRSAAVTPEYRDACAGADVIEVDCGHLVYYERPAIVAVHVRDFLAS